MRISSPVTHFFPGNGIFQLFQKKKAYFLSFEEKKASFWGGTKISSPASPCNTLSPSTRFVQAFGQSFSVIFTLHNSSDSLYRITELLSLIHI